MDEFVRLLRMMDMAPNECPDLVPANDKTLKAKRDQNAPLEEIVAIERACHFGAHYVYFRRPVGRPAMASAYIYNWMDRLGSAVECQQGTRAAMPQALKRELATLHRRCWSASEIPLVYVFLPTQVKEINVFHMLKGPRRGRHGPEANPWQVIDLVEDVANRLRALSARRLDDGRFWEENEESRRLRHDGAAFMELAKEIALCREHLVNEHSADPALVQRLLILFVLVKYLEEREDAQGNRVFDGKTFAQFDPSNKATCFVDLLRAGGEVVLAFLDHLASKDRFNGDVFALSASERESLLETELAPLADLLDARIEGNQRTFWPRYAFSELPVELISHIYEQFLPRLPGVVYTPPFLVNFVLDEALPLSASTPKNFRVLDPACGSGVFLVGAYKRLVHRWRRDNHYRDPSVKDLKQILRDHIFGVDTEPDAIHLTAFSLSVALCDFLDPKVIWNDLHFDNLKGSNLFTDDFFARVAEMRRSGFDLVVGNPPFSTELSAAAEAEVEEFRRAEPKKDVKHRFNLPSKQLALLFLKSATTILRPGGSLALLQPSEPLLYGERSRQFRTPLLRSIHVSQIVDLTHLSRVLFKRQWIRTTNQQGTTTVKGNPGDVPVAVVFAQKDPPPDEPPLLHVTVRRTVQAEQKLMFEIDHYDLHFVPRSVALNDPRVWKANFVGGGRIVHLLRRLGKHRDLGSFLKAKEAQTRDLPDVRDRWYSGDGYFPANKKKSPEDQKKFDRLKALWGKQKHHRLPRSEQEELHALLREPHMPQPAPWLTGKTMIPTKAFTVEGIDWSQETPITEDLFGEPRKEDLFTPPLLLIKDGIQADGDGVPTALVEDREVRFMDRIFGIHAPQSDVAYLHRIKDMVDDEKLLRFVLLATSGEYLISRSSSFRSSDLRRVPFPEAPDDLAFSTLDSALIDDALRYVADYKRKGEFSDILRRPDDDDLREFGNLFCKVLGSVYPSLRSDKPVVWPDRICFPFYFGAKPSHPYAPTPRGASELDGLLTAEVGSTVRVRRVFRVYGGNMLLLVKPAQLRYWLRSIAVRDADETFAELQEQGY